MKILRHTGLEHQDATCSVPFELQKLLLRLRTHALQLCIQQLSKRLHGTSSVHLWCSIEFLTLLLQRSVCPAVLLQSPTALQYSSHSAYMNPNTFQMHSGGRAEQKSFAKSG